MADHPGHLPVLIVVTISNYTTNDLLFAHWMKRKREIMATVEVTNKPGMTFGEDVGRDWKPGWMMMSPKTGTGTIGLVRGKGSQAFDAVLNLFERGETAPIGWHPDSIPLHRIIDAELDRLRPLRNPHTSIFILG